MVLWWVVTQQGKVSEVWWELIKFHITGQSKMAQGEGQVADRVFKFRPKSKRNKRVGVHWYWCVKKSTKSEVCERTRNLIYWFIEHFTKLEVNEAWREVVNRSIKTMTKSKVDERGGKIVNWLIETVTKQEVCEHWRELVYWPIKTMSKGKWKKGDYRLAY